jgi:hypothetical protein
MIPPELDQPRLRLRRTPFLVISIPYSDRIHGDWFIAKGRKQKSPKNP